MPSALLLLGWRALLSLGLMKGRAWQQTPSSAAALSSPLTPRLLNLPNTRIEELYFLDLLDVLSLVIKTILCSVGFSL